MNNPELFADIGYSQCRKFGEDICGDAFLFEKLSGENRIIAVLSDGLGSGVKANILATMTANMALKFVGYSREIVHSAEIMMSALPICQERKISYATFTIVDTALNGNTRIIEMGNPPFVLIRNGRGLEIPSRKAESPKWKNRTMSIYDFKALPGDRLILFSDGISQAGLGSDAWPLGWRREKYLAFIEETIAKDRNISAHELSGQIVREALCKEPGNRAGDDMTCASFYLRTPRKMLLLTGPPFNRERDSEYAQLIDTFDGDKAVCGGTTAAIISRELNRELKMDLASGDYELPPISEMSGVNLITEGIFTLTKTAQYLENPRERVRTNAAGKLVELLLNNDIIDFVVGTRINEAHQDPNLPLDLEIRRNIVKRLTKVLKKKYLKEVNIKFI